MAALAILRWLVEWRVGLGRVSRLELANEGATSRFGHISQLELTGVTPAQHRMGARGSDEGQGP